MNINRKIKSQFLFILCMALILTAGNFAPFKMTAYADIVSENEGIILDGETADANTDETTGADTGPEEYVSDAVVPDVDEPKYDSGESKSDGGESKTDAGEEETDELNAESELEGLAAELYDIEWSQDHWYPKTISKENITKIIITLDYDLPANPAATWSVGQLMCYIDDGILTITGDKEHAGISSIKLPQNAHNMFRGFTNVTTITGLDKLDASECTDMSCMFALDEELTGVDMSSWNLSTVEDMGYMFYGCTKLGDVKFPTAKMSSGNLESMRSMFYNCKALVNVNFGGLYTGKVSDMHNLFFGCSSLYEINPEKLDTYAVTDMAGMFCGCSSMEYFGQIEMDTSSVKDMSFMFAGTGTSKLDLSNMDTTSVEKMKCMFMNAAAKEIDIDGLKTGNVTDVSFMFYNCRNLETIIDEANFDTSKVTKYTNMFAGCDKLQGELGTGYSSKHAGKLYARLDQSMRKGYFSKFE